MVVLVFAFIGILWACYPLLTIPVYSGDAKIWSHDSEARGQDRPRWAETRPVAFIQQIIIKAAVRHAVHMYSGQDWFCSRCIRTLSPW